MKMKPCFATLVLCALLSTSFGQSKKELQDFIVEDLKKCSGTYLSTWGGKVWQKATNYTFAIQNCDLIITCRYASEGSEGDSKVIIPISDIVDVQLVKREINGDIETSPRLWIKTGGHTMRRYWNGKMIDMDHSEIIGLDGWTSDLADKYKSVFKQFSKFCD